MESKKHFLLESGVALAAISALLYCASAAWTGGYHAVLGLDGDVLERNFQQQLYDGFLLSFVMVLSCLFGYAAVRFLYAYLYLVALKDALKSRGKKLRYMLKVKRLFQRGREVVWLANEKKAALRAVGCTGVFFLVLLGLMHCESKGRERALEVLQQLEQQSYTAHKIVTVSINNKELELLLLSCGARNCAALDVKNRRVHYFSQDSFSQRLRKNSLQSEKAN